MTFLKYFGMSTAIVAATVGVILLGTINQPDCSAWQIANAPVSEISVQGVVNGIGEHAGKPVAYLRHESCLYKAEVRGDELAVLNGSYEIKSFGDMYSHIAEPSLVVYAK